MHSRKISKKTNIIKAWHFIRADRKLRYNDQREVKPGRWLKYRSRFSAAGIHICRRGMHASKNILDAVKFGGSFSAPVLCRVELKGDRMYGNGKICAEQRKVVWMLDASSVFFDVAKKICPRLWTHVRDKKGKRRKRRAPEEVNWEFYGNPCRALEDAFKHRRYSKKKCTDILIRAIMAARRKQEALNGRPRNKKANRDARRRKSRRGPTKSNRGSRPRV